MRFCFHWRKISVNEFVGEFNFPASLITRMATILSPSPFPLLFNANLLLFYLNAVEGLYTFHFNFWISLKLYYLFLIDR